MSSFTVTILGSGAALPTAQRNPSAQYVLCNNRDILIDCGEGTQNQLRKNNIKIQRLGIILISHLHGDHFFGLVGLLSTMHLLGRKQAVLIAGPSELLSIIESQLFIGGNQLGFNIEFIPLNGKESKEIYSDKCIRITTFPLKHRIPTNGFKIEEQPHERSLNGVLFKEHGLSIRYIPALKRGEDIELEDGTVVYADDYTFPAKPALSYAYCSDTAYSEKIVPFIYGVSALYHEATFLENMKERAKATYHSTAEQAAKIAALAHVGKLYLGHFSARYDSTEQFITEAKMHFPEVYTVQDSMQIRLR